MKVDFSQTTHDVSWFESTQISLWWNLRILLPLMDVKDDSWKQWKSLVGIHRYWLFSPRKHICFSLVWKYTNCMSLVSVWPDTLQVYLLQTLICWEINAAAREWSVTQCPVGSQWPKTPNRSGLFMGCTHLVGLPGTINANHLIQLATHPEMGLCVCLACHTGPSECWQWKCVLTICVRPFSLSISGIRCLTWAVHKSVWFCGSVKWSCCMIVPRLRNLQWGPGGWKCHRDRDQMLSMPPHAKQANAAVGIVYSVPNAFSLKRMQSDCLNFVPLKRLLLPARKLAPIHDRSLVLRNFYSGYGASSPTEVRCSSYLDINWSRPELELQTIRPKCCTSRRQIFVHVCPVSS